MIASIIDAAKDALMSWAHRIREATKKATKPMPPAATAVASVVVDTTRTKPELVAQNALLRQQLVVLGRSVNRPRINDGDRLIMVLLVRLAATRGNPGAWQELMSWATTSAVAFANGSSPMLGPR